MDRDGGNAVEFSFDKPGYGIYQLLTVTDNRVYAMTFDAGEGKDFQNVDYVVTAFDSTEALHTPRSTAEICFFSNRYTLLFLFVIVNATVMLHLT